MSAPSKRANLKSSRKKRKRRNGKSYPLVNSGELNKSVDDNSSLLLSNLEEGSEIIDNIHQKIKELRKENVQDKINTLFEKNKTNKLNEQFGSYLTTVDDYKPKKIQKYTYGILTMKQDIKLLQNFLGVFDNDSEKNFLAVLPKTMKFIPSPSITEEDSEKSSENDNSNISEGGSCEYDVSKNSHILRNGFLDYFLPQGNVKTINLEKKK